MKNNGEGRLWKTDHIFLTLPSLPYILVQFVTFYLGLARCPKFEY